MDLCRSTLCFAVLLSCAFTQDPDSNANALCGDPRWNTRGKAVIDVDHVADFNQLKSVAAYFCDNAAINVQLWRQETLLEFRLIWQYRMDPPSKVPGKQEILLSPDRYINVNETYRIGYGATEFGDLPLGMTFFPANQGSVVVSNADALPREFTIGNLYSFIELTFPFKFSASLCNTTASGQCKLPDISTSTRPFLNETDGGSGIPVPGPPGPMGVAGFQGPMGFPGIQGEIGTIGIVGIKGELGDIGPVGPPGDEGDRGQQGEVGPRGPPGPQGPAADPNPAAVGSQSCVCRGFSDPYLILGLICWAFVLTLLILIMVVLATKNPDLTS